MEKSIKLGKKVKDKVTGYIGILVSRCVYLNGCVQYCVQPKHESGIKLQEGAWIDESQLIVIDDGIWKEKKKPQLKQKAAASFKKPGGGIRNIPKGMGKY